MGLTRSTLEFASVPLLNLFSARHEQRPESASKLGKHPTVGRPGIPAVQSPISNLMRVLTGCILSAMVFAGCGASDSGDSNTSITEPVKPSAEDCGLAIAPPSAKSEKKRSSGREPVPTAGIYRYSTTGSQVVPGAGLRVKDLPSYSELLVTPSRKVREVTCFRVQRRFAPDIANTSTYVVRGENVYLVGLLIQVLGESQEVRPNPPVLFASNSGSSWSGQFGGSTYGSYAFSALGKRTYQVGTKRVRAVGMSSSVSFQGEVRGTQAATAWISLDDNVVVAEKVKSRQDFGVSALHLHSRSHLISLQPTKLRES